MATVAFARPEATYRSVDLAGRTGGEDAQGLVGVLYAECSRALRSAAWAVEHRRPEMRSEHVTRALSILFALEAGLDFARGGEVSKTLARLYGGARQRLVDASLGTDPAPFTDVAATLDEIGGAWAQARRA